MFEDTTGEADDQISVDISNTFEYVLCNWKLLLPIISKCHNCLRHNIDTNAQPEISQRGVALQVNNCKNK